MEEVKRLIAPATDQDVLRLKAGNAVLISGPIYTARDEAHKKLVDLIKRGEERGSSTDSLSIMWDQPPPPGKAVDFAILPPAVEWIIPPRCWPGMKTASAGQPRRLKALQKYKAVYLAAVGGSGLFW